MSINNKDIPVKSYFSATLFERMAAYCTAKNISQSRLVRESVHAALHQRRESYGPTPRRASTKVGTAFPGRRGGTPIPIRC
jgi:ribosomal protein L4